MSRTGTDGTDNSSRPLSAGCGETLHSSFSRCLLLIDPSKVNVPSANTEIVTKDKIAFAMRLVFKRPMMYSWRYTLFRYSWYVQTVNESMMAAWAKITNLTRPETCLCLSDSSSKEGANLERSPFFARLFHMVRRNFKQNATSQSDCQYLSSILGCSLFG